MHWLGVPTPLAHWPRLLSPPPSPPPHTHATHARSPLRFVDNSQAAADVAKTNLLLSQVHKRVVPVLEELEPVLRAFDASGDGYLPKQELLAVRVRVCLCGSAGRVCVGGARACACVCKKVLAE